MVCLAESIKWFFPYGSFLIRSEARIRKIVLHSGIVAHASCKRKHTQVVRLFAVNRVTPQAYAAAMATFKSADQLSTARTNLPARRGPSSTATVESEEGSKEHVLSGSNAWSIAVRPQTLMWMPPVSGNETKSQINIRQNRLVVSICRTIASLSICMDSLFHLLDIRQQAASCPRHVDRSNTIHSRQSMSHADDLHDIISPLPFGNRRIYCSSG